MYASGDLPSTACMRRASVRLLDATAFAASSSENPSDSPTIKYVAVELRAAGSAGGPPR
jgi:hypothetical protein